MGKAKVLITGGAGFIGKKLANFLSGKNFYVLVLDDLSSGNLKELNNEINFEKISILNKEKLEIQFKKFKPDYVFHLAALNMRSLNAGEELLSTNILGTQNVLRCSVGSSVKKVIFSSSAAVYGNAEKFPISESSKLKLLNIYGVSKVASEYLIKSILDESGISYSILRLSNVYGPGQRFDNEGGVVSIFCNNFKKGKKIVIFGDGRQTRDFIYVDDVLDALYKSMIYKGNFVVNVSTKKETSIRNVLNLIESVSKQRVNILYKQIAAKEIRRSVMDNSKIWKLLGWKPSIDLHDGIILIYGN
jgi:UDP-glucose 4-epimerase